MKKAAQSDNDAEPEHSVWGGRCCSVHRRQRFHELSLGRGSCPHTAFIQSKHGEGKQWRRSRAPAPPSTHTHTARRPAWQKKNGAKVMMRVKVWTRQLLQEVMTGTRNMLGKLVFSVSSHLLERCHLRLPGLDLVLLPVKVWMYGQSNRRPFLSRT